MIEMLKKTTLPTQPRIADIGTGSGCIGITAALELPGANVFLYDIDARSLQVASKNAQAHNVHVRAAKQNLLHGVTEHFDVLLANLPYVPEGYPINKAAAFEPRIALFAGDDGLDLYRTFWGQVASLEHRPEHIFTEALLGQHMRITELAKTAGYEQSGSLDLVQHFTRSGH
jgi:release factor glutamine methyltransferase